MTVTYVRAWNRDGDGRVVHGTLTGKDAANVVIHKLLCKKGSRLMITDETTWDYTTYLSWKGWEVMVREVKPTVQVTA